MASLESVSDLENRWYFRKEDINNSPSVLDGLDPALEILHRIDGAKFIKDLGNAMGLHYTTIATGITFFHRFYMVHSFVTFPRYVTACACLFLSGKVQETPKKCVDMLTISHALLTAELFAEFGENPKKKVITVERTVLQTIHFDFDLVLPYSFLRDYITGLHLDHSVQEKLAQVAWTLINDSYCTTVCLQWEPEVITVAVIYLATKLSKCQIESWANKTKNQKYWWEVYVEGLTVNILEDICHQILDYITLPQYLKKNK